MPQMDAWTQAAKSYRPQVITGTSQGASSASGVNPQGVSTPPDDGQVRNTDSISDPWAAAATQYKQQPAAAVTSDAQSPDWKVWQTQNTPDQPMPFLKRIESNWQSNTQSRPSDGSWQTALQNFGGRAANDLLAPILHPLETAKSLANMGIVGDITGQNPLLQRGQELRREWQQDKPLAVENVLGDAASAVLPAGLLKALPEIPSEMSRATQRARPSSSSAVVPPAEMAARKLTQIILPANKGRSGMNLTRRSGTEGPLAATAASKGLADLTPGVPRFTRGSTLSARGAGRGAEARPIVHAEYYRQARGARPRMHLQIAWGRLCGSMPVLRVRPETRDGQHLAMVGKSGAHARKAIAESRSTVSRAQQNHRVAAPTAVQNGCRAHRLHRHV